MYMSQGSWRRSGQLAIFNSPGDVGDINMVQRSQRSDLIVNCPSTGRARAVGDRQLTLNI